MSQIILQATLEQFLSALGLNRRVKPTEAQDGQRVYQINKCLSPTNHIGLAVAQRFWKWNPNDPLNHSKDSHVQAMREWRDKHCKIRLCYYNNRAVGGYVVVQGELMGMHNLHRGVGQWMLDHAINDGTVTLDCFDEPALIKLYISRGFTEERREAQPRQRQPDIVWMRKK